MVFDDFKKTSIFGNFLQSSKTAALFVFEFSDFEMFFIELDVCVPELNISVSKALASSECLCAKERHACVCSQPCSRALGARQAHATVLGCHSQVTDTKTPSKRSAAHM